MLEAGLLMNTTTENMVFPESLQSSFQVSAAVSKRTQKPDLRDKNQSLIFQNVMLFNIKTFYGNELKLFQNYFYN